MGKRNKIVFRADEIPSILNIYSLRVKNKEYERIPYKIWKQLKPASKWEVKYSYEASKWFQIIIDDQWCYSKGCEEIAGFCDFLLDYLEEKEQIESTMPVDYEKLSIAIDSSVNAKISEMETWDCLPEYSNKITITQPGKIIYSTLDTTSSNLVTIADSVEEKAKEVYKEMKENENIFKEKGDKNMKGFNFEFGTCEKDNVRMSMYGLAVQNATGSWVSYNAASKSVIDVDILNVDCRKYMFKMPVAMKDIKVGDIVIHNKKPMFVVDKTNGLTVIDVVAGEEKKILLTKNMFGFDFATKVVSMFDMSSSKATADSPFGNMLPLLLLGNEAKGDNDAMFMYMMMQGQSGFDPMMMMLLMGDNKSSNMLPLMFMMNQNKPKVVENKE